MDGVGIGSLPDAERFGDDGANTLGHILQACPELSLPTLASLGLGAVTQQVNLPHSTRGIAYTRSAFRNPAKDTITGHWELCGAIQPQPFPTYPNGFPSSVIQSFSQAIGRPVLGNVVASGTEILEKLGQESRITGKPIVYTSVDSVFQVAAHEEAVHRKVLYTWCRRARKLLQGEHAVGRVIARPFRGRPGRFIRTEGRRDFTLPVPGKSLLDLACEQGHPVHAIGKINDVFSGRGIEKHWPAGNNEAIMAAFDQLQTHLDTGIVIGTLVDFDTLYGHRNLVKEFARALQEFDRWLHDWLSRCAAGDLVVVTADHGCDPTWPTTDHTREWVPVLFKTPSLSGPMRLPDLDTLSDVGATIAEAMGIAGMTQGRSFWRLIT